jgi:hypothetical protein
MANNIVENEHVVNEKMLILNEITYEENKNLLDELIKDSEDIKEMKRLIAALNNISRTSVHDTDKLMHEGYISEITKMIFE